MHHVAMRIRGLALIVMVMTFLLSTSFHASADDSPSPSPDYQMLMNQYKFDLDQYRLLVQNREKARSQINRIFMAAVETANREARTAMKLAKTAASKNEILTNQKIAVTAASVARDAAIAALGSLPTPPVKPIKPVEVAILNKMKNKKSSPSPTK
ncbi:MAG: hypothetical protein EBW28_05210 [Actinobacteria bacterium]|jgi:hypothetical protein|nr:hypothetical protein [Actinomycetota bacterium]NCW42958.1 hypothetical protein [Actinomycetota bacterium]NCX16311.1 hypothetical protein [Actinomycetota bacterium]NCX39625.1 hypothetical protein [Actinomycetota bacterium]NCX51873.1 hypothetical protein [Actinomycetota bacterium]